jgi:hypothetical protein
VPNNSSTVTFSIISDFWIPLLFNQYSEPTLKLLGHTALIAVKEEHIDRLSAFENILCFKRTLLWWRRKDKGEHCCRMNRKTGLREWYYFETTHMLQRQDDILCVWLSVFGLYMYERLICYRLLWSLRRIGLVRIFWNFSPRLSKFIALVCFWFIDTRLLVILRYCELRNDIALKPEHGTDNVWEIRGTWNGSFHAADLK